MSSWGLGWKRSSEIFHLTLDYGDYNDDDYHHRQPSSPPPPSGTPSAAAAAAAAAQSSSPTATCNGDLGFRIELDWSASDDEDQVALRLQSQLMVALPPPHDAVSVDLTLKAEDAEEVGVEMRVVRRREALRSVRVARAPGSALGSGDGAGVLARLIRSNLAPAPAVDGPTAAAGVPVLADHWRSVSVLSLCNCGLLVLPVELTRLPLLEKLYLDNNKLSVLPPEVGALRNMKVLSVDSNMLVSVPAVELRQCVLLEELSLEHNKLVRPLLDFRSMSKLRVLRLFGNPLEFLPEILPLHNLRHLTLANIRIEALESLKSVTVQIETENSSYFIAARHKLSAFFSLVFRFSSCHHPLLASALAKIMEDRSNQVAISKEENAVRQLISMISSDNRHVVEQACLALSSLASDISSAMQLIKFGNLAFCLETRRTLMHSDSLRDLLIRLTVSQEHRVSKAAARALAILGKLVFAEPFPKDEAATWKEKIDQLFKSSSQSFRVVVHGSKHSADQFERLLKEMCADEDGDLLIESAVKGVPKYPPGTLEVSPGLTESPSIGATGTAVSGAPVGMKRGAFMGSCKHQVWQAIRASSAAPYYLDDFSDVERVEETLDTLIPMLPEMQYFRFNPVDERCGMELDETDPAVWLKMEAATEEYIQKNFLAFKNLCELLVPRYREEEMSSNITKSLSFSTLTSSNSGFSESNPTLGWRRVVLLVEASFSPDSVKKINHARSLETFCSQNGIRLALMNSASGFGKPATTLATPITSPLFTGSFPSSPLLYSPEGTQRIGRIDLVPPLSLDGHPTAKSSPPTSPLRSRQPTAHVRSLYDKLQNMPQVGVIHLALQNDSTGSVLSWQNDVFVVAEPGELADRFLQSVKTSLSTLLRGRNGR
ncbi:hypothetical protein PR202_ga29794 [Eleusine coracana subsp. coracana]|uniref:PNPLA domain-containing protein n=1 Tax=Eleusine coracana subsp. coracana TaxID=191504 RepID=A0AAV5DKX3_ELECO|nr:hypothetical protein PR202_ga29794 [Eleusine coracana subsp. coracana]